MNGNELFALRSDVRFRNVAGEGVVLRQEEGEVLVVNLVGVRILELIKEGKTFSEMMVVVEEEFDVESAALQEDVEKYIDELKTAEVLLQQN